MWTLRHSMTYCRFGADPIALPSTDAAASTRRSSQNGYTAVFGVCAAGRAVLTALEPPGSVRLTTPLVSTHAVLDVWPYTLAGNGSAIPATASSPGSGRTTSALTNRRACVVGVWSGDAGA